MPAARADGLRIAFDDLGTGEPALLLLPGWAVDRRIFGELASLTGTHRRTLALDWRGHGDSDEPRHDFGTSDLVNDALAVIEASGVGQVVPVALSHAGWVAIELARRLPERIPKLVFVSWIVLEPPRPFLELLRALADPERTAEARERLFSIWLEGVDEPRVERHVREDMGRYGLDMFRRAGREILRSYERYGAPLRRLAALGPRPALHVYADPAEDGYLEAQREFAAEHPWFEVEHVKARRHPVIELADELAQRVEAFVAQPAM